jgi:hypothetical protein
MANQKAKSNEYFKMRFSQWFSFLPLLFFVVPLLWMSFIRVGSMSVVLGFTLLGLALTSFLAKDWREYWEVIIRGMTKPSVAIFTLIKGVDKIPTNAY